MTKKNELIGQIKDLLYAADVKDPTMHLHVTPVEGGRIFVSFHEFEYFRCGSCHERSRLDRLISEIRLARCEECSAHREKVQAVQEALTARARKVLVNHVTMEAPPQLYRESRLIVVP